MIRENFLEEVSFRLAKRLTGKKRLECSWFLGEIRKRGLDPLLSCVFWMSCLDSLNLSSLASKMDIIIPASQSSCENKDLKISGPLEQGLLNSKYN